MNLKNVKENNYILFLIIFCLEIYFLTEKLNREKKLSQDLREHFQRDSASAANKVSTEPSHSQTPKNEKETLRPRLTSPQISQGILQPRQRTPNMNVNNSVDWRKARQKEDSQFSGILDTTKERGEDDSTKDFSSLRQGNRDNAIQCDLMLDKLADTSEYEGLLSQKDKEISRLKDELEKMKVIKNDLDQKIVIL